MLSEALFDRFRRHFLFLGVGRIRKVGCKVGCRVGFSPPIPPPPPLPPNPPFLAENRNRRIPTVCQKPLMRWEWWERWDWRRRWDWWAEAHPTPTVFDFCFCENGGILVCCFCENDETAQMLMPSETLFDCFRRHFLFTSIKPRCRSRCGARVRLCSVRVRGRL